MVIIGGGVIGCSVAYHLTKLGWKDVVLLERKELTSGTTWHAAGLIAQLRATANMTRLAKYSQELYGTLEDETGVATGFKRVGAITVALTEDRKEELFRQAAMARAFGVEIEEISPAEIGERYPHVNLEGVTAGVYLPKDGQGDPGNIALSLARGATKRGAKIHSRTKVTGMGKKGSRITAVFWQSEDGDQGEIACDMVVNCAGMWARDVGKMAGVNVPLHACEHYYIVTDNVPDLGNLPLLGKTGIHTFFNGPESFTPDDAYHLGLAPGTDNVWVAAGFNSIGIQSAGGAGMALAQWMEGGEKPFDLGDVDIARMQPFQGNKTYLTERVSETLGLLYADHYPFRQKVTSRGIRRSPLHEHLARNGAVFGELAGWERANWFANDGQKPEYEYSWKHPNWFDNAKAEHLAIRTGVGLYDMSSFGKIRIEGPDATAFLNHICGGEMNVPVGKIVYTQFLNARGGIEADVNITRLSELAYLVVTPAATRLADETWMRRHIGDYLVVITDVTAGEAVLAVMGPKSRDLLSTVSPNDFSNAANPFGTAQEIEIGMGIGRAHRVSFVGELGWEIYVSSDMAAHVFETLLAAGEDHGLKLCGLHMMDGCRIEKGFRHFGHDITCEDHVLEAGLGFAVKTEKPDFIGRDAVLAKRESGLTRRIVLFRLNDPEPLLFHNEPILRDGKIVGHLTSGAYGHHVGAAVGMGYIGCAGETASDFLASSYSIDVAGTVVSAEASLRPFYDQPGDRTKS